MANLIASDNLMQKFYSNGLQNVATAAALAGADAFCAEFGEFNALIEAADDDFEPGLMNFNRLDDILTKIFDKKILKMPEVFNQMQNQFAFRFAIDAKKIDYTRTRTTNARCIANLRFLLIK